MASTDMFVENFKNKFYGGGARSNLFKAMINIKGSEGLNEQISFLCKAASLPGSTVTEIPVPFRGREIKVSGDRTFEPWEITIINDKDFSIRNAFEKMMNDYLNSHSQNLGNQEPASYKNNMSVMQLDKNGNEVKTYNFFGVFPSVVAPIEVSFESTNQIEEFGVTLQYDYWTADTTDQPSATTEQLNNVV